MRRRFGAMLTAVSLATGIFAVPVVQASESQTYVILYRSHDVAADAATRIARAGGTLVVAYDEIGVAVARSSRSNFASNLMTDRRIEGVAASNTPVASVGPQGVEDSEGHGQQPPELPNAPVGQDNLAPLQWDMRQIHAPEAHLITGGSPAVVVADIDTGVDKDHPDLDENIDLSRSASCESGVPDQDPEAWDDRHGHGTHTTGTIAAAANGFGITGVAPNVKIAAVKSSTDEGYFFVHMVVCSFMWVGGAPIDNPTTPGLDFPATVGPRADVSNNSYFMDPFLYNCRNDAAQRLLWKAAQRAILFAYNQGVTNVASMGNDSDDKAHPAYDSTSPDYPPNQEQEREITNACVVVPVEVPGVIGVSAVGNQRQTDGDQDPNDFLKSYYSAYGVGVADVTAPGGDSRQITAEAPNGRVLSTWPEEIPCTRQETDVTTDVTHPVAMYCYLQGTSMASPHAAGVAALIISRFGDPDSPQNGKMRPGAVEQYMEQTADPQPCPTEVPANYPTRPHFEGEPGEPQECQGGEGYNSWYGSGQINAFRAVTHDAGSSN